MSSAAPALQFWQPRSSAAHPWLRALVTTRHGGTSAAPYDSLNLGLATGDAPERVHENRTRVQQALGIAAGRLQVLHQVHGTEIWDVPGACPAAGDGLRTTVPQFALAVGIADCVPAFAWDTRQRRLALLHAGWRGTAAGILARALSHFLASGSRATDLHVALGPCIGPCCYAVSADVAAQFPAVTTRPAPGGTYLDLRHANRIQAEALGILPQNIEADPPCTGCNLPQFFSHRREQGRTGRMWAIAWIDTAAE